MSDQRTVLRAASAQLVYPTSNEQLDRLRATVAARIARRALARRVAVLGASLLALTLALGSLWRARASDPPVAAAANPSMRWPDGTQVELLSRASRVRIVEERPERVIVRLSGGSARFSVAPRRQRELIVQSGSFEVKVIGARFVVAHLSDGIEVQVESGRARVLGPAIHAGLEAGEARRFHQPPPAPSAGTAPSATAATPAQPAPSALLPRTVDWRALAKARQYGPAYRALMASPPASAPTADELLLRADVARLSGHPADAIEPLRTLVQRFPADSRVPSAWFTLGGVEQRLGRSSRAAESFRRARELQPSGPLAADALAREAFALLAGGSRAQAEVRAREYLKRYPGGVQVSEIKRQFELP